VKRAISYTEVATLLECQARHDFSYVGQLAGSALARREAHVRLREGRAWGRAVSALHGWDPEASVERRYGRALAALHVAVAEDRDALRRAGVYDETRHDDLLLHLEAVLWHYAFTAEPLAVTEPELELRVAIPSRASLRASSRYEFHGFLDGLSRDDWGLWIVEYKLRGRLSGTAQVQLGRQYRFYAWAAERVLGEQIQGVIVDERLNTAPKDPRVLKNGTPSHAKDQLVTAEAYTRACAEAGVEPQPDTAEALGARKWQARERVIFTRSEIATATRELQTAARLIAQFDAHTLYPLRNPGPHRCPGCAYRDICAHPEDHELVDALFERRPPKALRHQEAA
jgi:hypothetical protein